MKTRIDWLEGGRIALFSLRANRLRTLLTILGVGIGVATLISIAILIHGMNTFVGDLLGGMGATNLYIQKQSWSEEWWKSRDRKDLELNQLLALRAVPHVDDVSIELAGERRRVSFFDRARPSISVMGVTPNYARVNGVDLRYGRMFGTAENLDARHVVVLGAKLASALLGGLNPIGRKVRIGASSFTVVGVLEENEMSDQIALLPLHTFESVFDHRRGFFATAHVDALANLPAAMDGIRATLRRLRHTPPGAQDDFGINQSEDLQKSYRKVTRGLFALSFAIGAITLLVGGIGIMNIMLVSVRERTREIGLRRALGARRRTIVIQFLLEAAVVSALGGLCGVLAGLGFGRVVAFLEPFIGVSVPLSLPWAVLLGAVAFSALIGLSFGLWPAVRASQLDPVEALRYE